MKYHEFRGIFIKSSQIRDFQETRKKPQISEDSELGGCELGDNTVHSVRLSFG